jgi:hypothetical protein
VDLGLASFRERHGREGGETNADSEILEESFAKTGATLMGRRMFSGGQGRSSLRPSPTSPTASSRDLAKPYRPGLDALRREHVLAPGIVRQA